MPLTHSNNGPSEKMLDTLPLVTVNPDGVRLMVIHTKSVLEQKDNLYVNKSFEHMAST